MAKQLGLVATLAIVLLGTGAPALETPTFTADVARIFQARCQTCHRPGEHAPFPLLTYRDAYQRRDDIRDAIRGRDMPPLGTPDHVIEMVEPYTVPARASDVYRCFVIPTNFPEDRWVTKAEFAPRDRKLVHHILSYIDTTGTAETLDRADPGPGYTCFGGPRFMPAGGLSGWAPGVQPRVMEPGIGMLLPKGATVVLQMHYNNTAPRSRTDRTRMALHFARAPIDKRQRSIPIANRVFTIPAGERRHEVQASWTVPAHRTLHANTIAPHMHLLGREMKVTATYPDGTVVPLIHIDGFTDDDERIGWRP